LRSTLTRVAALPSMTVARIDSSRPFSSVSPDALAGLSEQATCQLVGANGIFYLCISDANEGG
jgi:hypothetical protein